MRVARKLADVGKDPNSVVTVGSFDGVHLAHREIIREMVHRARMREGRSIVITFDPHPSEVVRPNQQTPLLTTLDERIGQLNDQGVDVVCVLKFTPEFANLSSEEFYRSVVVEEIGVSEVIVGYDHMFGRGREAGVRELVSLGKTFNFSVFAVHPHVVDGMTVSSTLIRRLLSNGEVRKAGNLLGYSYSLHGRVVPGDGRGKELGYPTANIEALSNRKVVPGRGVYLVGVRLGEQSYFGMMNIGTRPTVTDSGRQTLEVHLLDLGRDIYGEELRVTFLKKLRDEQKFSSMDDLRGQLDKDRQESLKLISEIRGQF